MPTRNRRLLFVAAIGLLAGCTSQKQSIVDVSKVLSVSGDSNDVARFVKLEAKWQPGLVLVSFAKIDDSKSKALLQLPAQLTPAQLIELTRHALLADLSYSYDESRRTRR